MGALVIAALSVSKCLGHDTLRLTIGDVGRTDIGDRQPRNGTTT